MSTLPLREKILSTIIEKSTLKQRVYDNYGIIISSDTIIIAKDTIIISFDNVMVSYDCFIIDT